MIELSVVGSILLYFGTFGISGILSKLKIRSNLIKIFLIIILPILLATFRYNIGYDYGSYIDGYYYMCDVSVESIFNSYEIGDPIAFDLLTKFATMFNSERIFLMFLSLFSIMPGISYILGEWDIKDIKSMIIFAFLFDSFLFSFSACKQGIALSILMYSLKYVYKRKPFKFLGTILIASLFHSTAILFGVIYFLLDHSGDISFFKKIFMVVGCVIVVMNLELVLSQFLDGRYESYATELVEGRNRTFWLYSFITCIFLLFRKKLVSIDKRNDLLIMMMLIGTIFQYLGFFNAFTKRIGEYFLMAQVILIPQCIYLFTFNSRRLAKFLIVMYIVAIFLIGTPTAPSGMGFVPFRFKFK